jgi:hypothetical protein
MCYSVPNDSGGGGEDGSRARWQQNHLEVLLAEQLVVDEFARGSNPEPTLASHAMSEQHDDVEEHEEHVAPQLECPLL